ncbi:Mth938-like domain-containing protein [Notoacmeibacter sp. MSK16QG-6]|uniref:Mth938-like domain-containing protein n=1 Tax=Notoacmeibacter sp. MSK16QG-6 TaxID=2957982 RepID=UPI0020A13646|nr:Mth938-like domain-containing protein [Notoacmeibacter sp. MSK16QG-6]MCP1199380.1 Mth938-like domain-containing protein [Notoacmeibacter sp. MSK16QG-6]
MAGEDDRSGGSFELRPAHFPGRPPIDAYGNGGFRFADMSHRGSLLLLPSGVRDWYPEDPDQLHIEDFQAVLQEADAIEILLVGTGVDLKPLPREVRPVLRDAGISADPMATGAAVRTYNVLLAEERAVAAMLIAVE